MRKNSPNLEWNLNALMIYEKNYFFFHAAILLIIRISMKQLFLNCEKKEINYGQSK